MTKADRKEIDAVRKALINWFENQEVEEGIAMIAMAEILGRSLGHFSRKKARQMLKAFLTVIVSTSYDTREDLKDKV